MKRINLKLFRVKQKLSQQEMAERLKVGRSTYIDIENGKRDGSIRFFNQLQDEFQLTDDEVWNLTKKEGE